MEYFQSGTIVGTVISDEQFEISIRLSQYTPYAILKKPIPIVSRHNNRYQFLH